LNAHPAAGLFPMLSAEELQALADDIAANGLNNPVVVYEDQVLDGRNRSKACEMAGVSIKTTQWVDPGCGPVAYVISQNIHRRHLTATQRAVLAVDLLPQLEEEALSRMAAGGRRRLDEGVAKMPHLSGLESEGLEQAMEAYKSRDRAAELTQVAPRYISDAKKIAAESPEKLDRMRSGELSLQEAKREIRKENRPAPRPIVAAEGTYPILYADPPWRYDHNETPDLRDIENHYPTMPVADICALDVPAAEDAVLFLWATNPKLIEALEVMKAWGFEYRTNACWTKDRFGMGYYVRGQHELLLIGKRGNIRAPEPSNRPGSVVAAPRQEHSRKPDEFYELIERMYPGEAKCELFARRPRVGWVGWGNQLVSAA